jgi:hypothetical protein
MQTPPLAEPFPKGKVGYIVALVGSALSILAFLAFSISTSPASNVASRSSNSSTTFLQFVQQLQEAQKQLQSLPTSYNDPSLYGNIGTMYDRIFQMIPFIWASLVISIVACIVALIFTIRPVSRAVGGAVSLIILGLLGAGAFLYLIITIAGFISDLSGAFVGGSAVNGFSYIGFGAWLCVIGMVMAVIGGIVAITSRSSLVVPGYGSTPQPPQYPANPYTQYPPQQPPSYPSYPPQQPPQR